MCVALKKWLVSFDAQCTCVFVYTCVNFVRIFVDNNEDILGNINISFILSPFSLQFDPAPRRGEPHVTRRTPDYFL